MLIYSVFVLSWLTEPLSTAYLEKVRPNQGYLTFFEFMRTTFYLLEMCNSLYGNLCSILHVVNSNAYQSTVINLWTMVWFAAKSTINQIEWFVEENNNSLKL